MDGIIYQPYAFHGEHNDLFERGMCIILFAYPTGIKKTGETNYERKLPLFLSFIKQKDLWRNAGCDIKTG